MRITVISVRPPIVSRSQVATVVLVVIVVSSRPKIVAFKRESSKSDFSPVIEAVARSTVVVVVDVRNVGADVACRRIRGS